MTDSMMGWPEGLERRRSTLHSGKPTSEQVEIRKALGLVEAELIRVNEMFAPFHSRHEGWAVLKEEVDELWDAIKDKHSTPDDCRNEAKQVAAMAVRIMVDL